MGNLADSIIQPTLLSALPEEPMCSVLVANFNYANYIGQAIESVLHQTYQRFEVIICDDGSTDNSIEIVQAYVDQNPMIQLVVKKNGGMASALNRAYERSSGHIFCLLDADDLFEPEKLAQVVEAFKRNPNVGLVMHRVLRINSEGHMQGVLPLFHKIPSGWFGPELLYSGGILSDLPPCSGLSLHRDVARVIFPINEAFKSNADGVVHKIAPLVSEVLGLDSSLARYRLHNTNLTNSEHLTAERQKREWKIWQALWQEQRAFLQSIDPELADRFAPIERNLGAVRMRYVIARLEQDGTWKDIYHDLINHKDFWNQSRVRSTFWAVSGYLPNRIFTICTNIFSGQSTLKKLVWKLSAKKATN